ncbi:MAG TPA: hypothetical protein VG983_10475 [Caulobacterales bacterium]|jgi:hypothetical protein|nr:hypothetical protein [Caulobacterales bacterium]
MTAASIEPERTSVRAGTRSFFYVRVAALAVFIAFAGFAPSFWIPLATNRLKANPIVFIHGFAMTGWTIFLLVQAWMVASGNVRRHRALGMAGIALATAICIFGPLMVLNSIHIASLALRERALRFSAVSLMAIVIFAGVVTAAFANTHRPETHKRLLFVATFGALSAAIGRWFNLLRAPHGAIGPPPVEVTLMPASVVDLILLGLMVHDWRTRGRVEPAYLIAVPILIAQQVLTVPLSRTDAWLWFATWFANLPGVTQS